MSLRRQINSTVKCTGCEKSRSRSRTQWWSLQNYNGATGYFCATCYKVLRIPAKFSVQNETARHRLLQRIKERGQNVQA